MLGRRTGREQTGADGSRRERRSLPPAPARSRPLPSRLLASLKRVLGMPDYAAHLAHLRAHHPDCPLPTEREFYDQYLRTRYGDGATRCC